ncbi:micu1, partial [Symbiodinium sp. KB8]
MAARAVFSRLYRALPAVPCLLAVGHCSLACHVSAEGGTEDSSTSWKDTVTGGYENRLRRHAAPEKLFEYFSSVHDGETGDSFMTPDDLLRALSPYNPALPSAAQQLGTNNPMLDGKALAKGASAADLAEYTGLLRKVLEGGADAKAAATAALALRTDGRVSPSDHVTTLSREGLSAAEVQAAGAKVLPGVNWVSGKQAPAPGSAAATFAALVDEDGDGLISFGQYMLFITVLSLPRSHLDLAFRLFDSDDSGTLDQAEYTSMMGVVQGRTPAGQQVRDKDLLGRNLGRLSSVGLPPQASGAGTLSDPKQLSLGQFREFVQGVHQALHKVEFERYGGMDGGLTPRDFALLVIGNAPPALQRTLRDRLAAASASLSQDETISFAELERYYMLLDELPALQVAMSLSGPLAAARASTKEGLAASPGTAGDRGLTRDQFRLVTGVVLSEESAEREGRVPAPGSAAQHALGKGATEVLYALFDADGDGLLSIAE